MPNSSDDYLFDVNHAPFLYPRNAFLWQNKYATDSAPSKSLAKMCKNNNGKIANHY